MVKKMMKYEKPALVVFKESTMETGHGATCTTGGFQAFCQNGTGAASNCGAGTSVTNCSAGGTFGLS